MTITIQEAEKVVTLKQALRKVRKLNREYQMAKAAFAAGQASVKGGE